MGTIAEKLQALLTTKDSIKSAIIEKGVSVSDSDPFSAYAAKVRAISQGGGTSGLSLDCTSGGITALRAVTGGTAALTVPTMNCYYGGIE